MFTPSDFMLIVWLATNVAFTLSFVMGRGWWTEPLGWTMLLFALSVDALLALIVYGIVFGQAIDEPYRLAVAVAGTLASIAKFVILLVERDRGRRIHAATTIERIDQ